MPKALGDIFHSNHSTYLIVILGVDAYVPTIHNQLLIFAILLLENIISLCSGSISHFFYSFCISLGNFKSSTWDV